MVIVMEHRDRLARFGVEHLQAALPARAAGLWSPTMMKPPRI
jgi:predicted site-specific integrase-resolvase